MRFIITTPLREQELREEEQSFIRSVGFPFVPRQGRSLAKLKNEYEAEGILVWQKQGPVLHINNGQFFFHPGMAYHRLIAHRNYQQIDAMVKACQLAKGESFLDCTLGLGADAIVASYFLPGALLSV